MYNLSMVYKKGIIPWNKGTKGVMKFNSGSFKKGEHRSPQTEFKKVAEEKHPRWKGDKVGYGALHDWIRKHKGTPSTCEECGKENLFGMKIHWANISGNYKRDLNDWRRLCVKCHSHLDRNRNTNL